MKIYYAIIIIVIIISKKIVKIINRYKLKRLYTDHFIYVIINTLIKISIIFITICIMIIAMHR